MHVCTPTHTNWRLATLRNLTRTRVCACQRGCGCQIPHVELSATIQPITRGILRITLEVTPAFKWSTKIHGNSEPWWIWVEDAENDHMYAVAPPTDRCRPGYNH